MLDQLKPLLGKLALFSQQRMGFKHPPKLFLRNDASNSQQALGKTAFYNPEEQSVTLFVHGRHPKDILRSFAHELVHHTQNLRGDFTSEKMGEMGSNYAQDNEHLRNMEKEAYLDGNMCFRDWEDTIEDKDLILIKLAESKFLKENKTMTTKITKEFLKDTIRNVLMERMSDEDFVAYAQRNKYAKDTQAYRDAVARIEKKKEMAAAKAAEPSKLQKGIASYFKDSPVVKSYTPDAGTEDPSDTEKVAKKPEKKDSKFMRGLKNYFSSMIKENDEETLKEFFSEMINEIELEEGKCSSSHAPGKRCEECGYMEESDTIEEGGCGKCGTPECTCKMNENEELEEANSDVKMVPKDEVSDEDEVVVPDGPGNLVGVKKESIQTPEQENKLYENRFAPRNNRLFEKLVKDWTK